MKNKSRIKFNKKSKPRAFDRKRILNDLFHILRARKIWNKSLSIRSEYVFFFNANFLGIESPDINYEFSQHFGSFDQTWRFFNKIAGSNSISFWNFKFFNYDALTERQLTPFFFGANFIKKQLLKEKAFFANKSLNSSSSWDFSFLFRWDQMFFVYIAVSFLCFFSAFIFAFNFHFGGNSESERIEFVLTNFARIQIIDYVSWGIPYFSYIGGSPFQSGTWYFLVAKSYFIFYIFFEQFFTEYTTVFTLINNPVVELVDGAGYFPSVIAKVSNIVRVAEIFLSPNWLVSSTNIPLTLNFIQYNLELLDLSNLIRLDFYFPVYFPYIGYREYINVSVPSYILYWLSFSRVMLEWYVFGIYYFLSNIFILMDFYYINVFLFVLFKSHSVLASWPPIIGVIEKMEESSFSFSSDYNFIALLLYFLYKLYLYWWQDLSVYHSYCLHIYPLIENALGLMFNKIFFFLTFFDRGYEGVYRTTIFHDSFYFENYFSFLDYYYKKNFFTDVNNYYDKNNFFKFSISNYNYLAEGAINKVAYVNEVRATFTSQFMGGAKVLVTTKSYLETVCEAFPFLGNLQKPDFIDLVLYRARYIPGIAYWVDPLLLGWLGYFILWYIFLYSFIDFYFFKKGDLWNYFLVTFYAKWDRNAFADHKFFQDIQEEFFGFVEDGGNGGVFFVPNCFLLPYRRNSTWFKRSLSGKRKSSFKLSTSFFRKRKAGRKRYLYLFPSLRAFRETHSRDFWVSMSTLYILSGLGFFIFSPSTIIYNILPFVSGLTGVRFILTVLVSLGCLLLITILVLFCGFLIRFFFFKSIFFFF